MELPPARPPFQSFLARRAREGATVEQLTAAVVAAWQQIDLTLAPLIGKRGVGALYMRSLHLASAEHPGLRPLLAGNGLEEMNLGALQAALLQQDTAVVAAMGDDLLLSFHGLVGSLIGTALSSQLLGSVWTQLFGGPTPQDPPP